MPKTIKNTLAGGELSTDLEGRTDLAKYATGVQLMSNFFPTRFGGASNRPGTEYLGYSLRGSSDTARQARLIPFTFSVNQTYALEFTANIMRVIKDGSIVLTSRRSATYKWTASGSGTDEWYLELAGGGDPFSTGIGAKECWENGTQMTEGTAGSLAVGEWALADNDSLGYTTVYVRLTATGDPDLQDAGWVQTDYQLWTGLAAAVLPDLSYAQSADTLFLAQANVNNQTQPAKITRTLDDAWTYTSLTFSPTVTTPSDFYATKAGFTTTDRDIFYKVSAIDSDLNESLPTAEKLVQVDLNWTDSTDRVDLFWNNIADGTESTPIFEWVASGSGTAEYYCKLNGGGDPSISEPSQLWEDKVEATKGTLGSLAAGEWGYGDNDSLGYSTVYIRLTDGTDPDTKATGWITYKLSTEDQWSVYKNSRGDWGWMGTVQTPWFLDDNVEPDVSITPKEDRDPFTTGDSNDYPGAVGIFEQRLIYARSNNNPQRVWASVTGDLTNYATSKPISAEDPIIARLISGGRMDEIRHVLALQRLLIYTIGSEWTMTNGDNSDALTPASVQFRNQGYDGCSETVPPLGISNRALFVQRNNKEIRATSYRAEDNGYPSAELTLLAQHLFEDNTIVDWAYQQHPHNIIWIVMSDGTMVSMTYLPDQEVIAFARHSTDGKFKSVCSIKGSTEDEVYFIVERTLNSTTVSTLEKMSTRAFGDNVRDARFLDCALSYNSPVTITNVNVSSIAAEVFAPGHGFSEGDFVLIDDVVGVTATGNNSEYTQFNDRYYKVLSPGATSFLIADLEGNALTSNDLSGTYESGGNVYKCVNSVSGLDHLEGETVSVLADGQAIGTFTVSSGSITLGTSDPGYGVVHVGLPYNCDIQTLRFDLATGGSTVQYSKKNIKKLIFRFKKSSGGSAGPDSSNLTTIKWRQNEEWLEPNALKTEDVEHKIKSTWDREGRIYFRQSDPLPTTILAIIMEYETGDF